MIQQQKIYFTMDESLITSEEQSFVEAKKDDPPKITMTTAIVSMMAAALGTGIFNLPLRITEIGVLTFIVYVIISAHFSYFGASFIVRLSLKYNLQSYSDMSESALGKPLKFLSEFFLILFPWGIAVCFQVIMVKFLVQLGADVFDFNFYEDRNAQIYNNTGNLVRILLNIAVISTNFFFIAKKQIGIIQKLAKAGVLIVFYNTITIFIILLVGFTRTQQPFLTYHGLFSLDWSNVAWVTYAGWQSFSQHVQALSSILFCYVNHQLVFIILKTMEKPSPQSFSKTFKLLNLGQTLIYLFIGLSGYFLLVEHQATEPIGPMVITSIDTIPMTIGKTLMCLTLYFGIPLSIFPARQIFYQGFSIEKTTKNHLILSGALAASSCIVAILFQKVNSYFGLLGGTAGVMMAGGIPAICFFVIVLLKKNKIPLEQQDTSKPDSIIKDSILLVFFLVVTLFTFTGAILSVIDPA